MAVVTTVVSKAAITSPRSTAAVAIRRAGPGTVTSRGLAVVIEGCTRTVWPIVRVEGRCEKRIYRIASLPARHDKRTTRCLSDACPGGPLRLRRAAPGRFPVRPEPTVAVVGARARDA